MTRDDGFTDDLAAYLRHYQGATPLPDPVREAVRSQVSQTKQIRRFGGLRRYLDVTLPSAPLGYGLMAAFAVVVAAALLRGLPTGRNAAAPTPSSTVRSPSPTPTVGRPVAGSWMATGSMIEGRAGHSATLLPDGRVLVAGGFRSGKGVVSAELYDPRTGAWTATGSLHEGRGGHSATLLPDGMVLVAGGISVLGTDNGIRALTPDVVLASAELYDPRTGRWTTTGHMTEARRAPAVLLSDGRVLVAGGWGAGQIFGPKLASAEVYDPVTGTWTATGSMAQRRDGHSATLLANGTVLVAGGYDYVNFASAELYDPTTRTWAATGSLPEPVQGHTENLLTNGMVLIAGGDVSSGPGPTGSAHAALYDVATGTWSMTGSMITPRLGLRRALLPDGRVLIVGGGANGGPESGTFSSGEVYDPATGTWAPTASMTAARARFSATLLADGRVLVVGGVDDRGDSEPLASAELYALGD
jgi:N-acetylneuraminic acid mutarotase